MKYSQEAAYAEMQLGVLHSMLAGKCSPIERKNLQSRLSRLEEEVRLAQQRARNLAELDLLFEGNPVYHKQGIEAAFAGESLSAFQEYIATLTAACQGEIGNRGPLPRVPRLMVTDVETGSFGFQLSELPEQEPLSPTPLKEAIEEGLAILRGSASSDEAFTEVIAQQNQRVSAALRKFLGVLESREATLRIKSPRSHVEITDARGARERVENTQILESEETHPGLLCGWRIHHRDFELQLNHGEVLSGRIEGDAVLEQGARLLMQRVQATLQKVSVERGGQTRVGWSLRALTS